MAGLPYAAIRNNRGVAVFKSMPHGPDCVNLRNPDPRLNSSQTSMSGADADFDALHSQIFQKLSTLKCCHIATDQLKIAETFSKIFYGLSGHCFVISVSHVYYDYINPG